MGDPINPTAKDRAETRALCARIVQSVVEDAPMPLPLTAMSMSHLSDIPVFDKADVEDLVMQLALEVAELQRERDEARRVARSAATMAKGYAELYRDDVGDEEEIADDIGQAQHWLTWAKEKWLP